MERFQEMIESVEALLTKIIEEKILHIIDEYKSDKSFVEELYMRMKELTTDTEGCLCISYLRSSYITGSNDFQVAYYSEDLFVEEYPECFYYRVSISPQDTKNDIQYLRTHLQKQFIRITYGEMEELRRYYMENLYQRCGNIFNLVLDEHEKGKTAVYFGEYMGEVMQIGKI